jgi:site-specific DNA-methyltransferase (adenine-specific)
LVLSQTDYQSIHEPCLYGWFDNGKHNFYADRKQTSVWEYERKSVEGHTTPKPIDLIANALKNSSKKDEKVLDLFGGSGSTLIACEQLNRKCFMMELDEHYCDVIITRWENLTGQKAVLCS